MADPRIIPAETLAEWKAAARSTKDWGYPNRNREAHAHADRILALIEHCKALAEVCPFCKSDPEALADARAEGWRAGRDEGRRNERAHAEAAEAENDAWRAATGDPSPEHAKATNADLAASLTTLAAQCDAAEQRLAERDEAIRELAGQLERGYPMVRAALIGADLRALLTQDGA